MKKSSVLPIVVIGIFAVIAVIHLCSRKPVIVEPDTLPVISREALNCVREQAKKGLIVYFIPGWMTKYSKQYEQEEILRKIYPHSTVKSQSWESLRWWSFARDNADQFGRDFALYLRQTHPNELDKVVLVGHSLGGRVVIRTLNALGPDHHVNHAVLLGAAINYDDDELKMVGANDDGNVFVGTKGPILNFHHRNDRVLQEAFQVMENSPALGRVGALPPPPNGIQSFETHLFMAVADDQIVGRGLTADTVPYSEDENERALETLFLQQPSDLDDHFQSLDLQIKQMIESSNVPLSFPESDRNQIRSESDNRRVPTSSPPGQIDELVAVLQVDLPYEAMYQSTTSEFALTSPKDNTKTSMIIGGARAVMNLPSHDSREYLRFFMEEMKDFSNKYK